MEPTRTGQLADRPAFEARPREPAAVAIYQVSWTTMRAEFEIGVSPSGLLVWSEPGSPDGGLRQAFIAPQLVDELLARLEAEGVFRDSVFSRVQMGFHSSFTILEITSGGGSVRLRSWHEGFERTPQLVATDLGVRPLRDGETRAQAMAACSDEYRHYRRVWALIRDTLASWRPAVGAAYAGGLALRGTRLRQHRTP